MISFANSIEVWLKGLDNEMALSMDGGPHRVCTEQVGSLWVTSTYVIRWQ